MSHVRWPVYPSGKIELLAAIFSVYQIALLLNLAASFSRKIMGYNSRIEVEYGLCHTASEIMTGCDLFSVWIQQSKRTVQLLSTHEKRQL